MSVCQWINIVFVVGGLSNSSTLFREQALSLLTNERGVLNDFVDIHFDVMSGAAKQAYLMILLKSFNVLSFDAKDASVSEEILGLFKAIDDMYGWCRFEDGCLAKNLATKLGVLDVSQPLPHLSSIVSDFQQRIVSAGASSANAKPDAIQKTPRCNPYTQSMATLSSISPSKPSKGMSRYEVASSDASVFRAINMSSVNFKYDERKIIERDMGFKVKVSGVFQHYMEGLSYARVILFALEALYYLNGKFLRIPYDKAIDQLFT